MKLFIKSLAVCAAVLSSAAFAQSAAQPFPQRPVTFVVPWAPGGGTDYVARKFAQSLRAIWNQPVVVENVAGASSIIGAQRVAKAAPDGHTLMMTTNGTITGNRFLFKQLPYDPDRDFAPITQLTDIDMVILANANLPANNLKEFVALAKKEPGRISYASYGKGSQPELLFGLFSKRENMELIHVPYKGVAPALTAVMSGEANVTLTGRGTGAAAINSGKTKVLAYMSDARDSALPNVPTSAEAGFSYVRVPTWHGLFAPPNTPVEVIEKIQRDVARIATDPEFQREMAVRGYHKLPGNTPAQFAAVIRDEVKLTAEMVEAAGLTPD
jgi:tripartite-type tricarboxylate transporter receptor subunit TctC